MKKLNKIKSKGFLVFLLFVFSVSSAFAAPPTDVCYTTSEEVVTGQDDDGNDITETEYTDHSHNWDRLADWIERREATDTQHKKYKGWECKNSDHSGSDRHTEPIGYSNHNHDKLDNSLDQKCFVKVGDTVCNHTIKDPEKVAAKREYEKEDAEVTKKTNEASKSKRNFDTSDGLAKGKKSDGDKHNQSGKNDNIAANNENGKADGFNSDSDKEVNDSKKLDGEAEDQEKLAKDKKARSEEEILASIKDKEDSLKEVLQAGKEITQNELDIIDSLNYEYAMLAIKEDIDLTCEDRKEKYGVTLNEILDNFKMNNILADNKELQLRAAEALLVLDPANVATGENIQNITDLNYSYLGNNINISRRYSSNDIKDFSFGKGWAFSYDSRVIYGVKFEYQEQVDLIKASIVETNRLKTIIENSFIDAKEEMRLSILEGQNAIDEANKAIKSIERSIVEIDKAIASGKLSVTEANNAKSKISSAINKAKSAINKAQDAIDSADSATRSANSAIRSAGYAKDHADDTKKAIESGLNHRTNAEVHIKSAITFIGLAISAAERAKTEAGLTSLSSLISEADRNHRDAVSTKGKYEENLEAIKKYKTTLNDVIKIADDIIKDANTIILASNGKLTTASTKRGIAVSKKDVSERLKRNLESLSGRINDTYNRAVAARDAAIAYKLEVEKVGVKAATAKTNAETRKGEAEEALRLLKLEELRIAGEIAAELKDLGEKLVIAENEAALARSNENRNKFNIDPDLYDQQYMSNYYIELVDFNGMGRVYKILAKPNYNSIKKYADGTKNFYPEGSTLEAIGNETDIVKLLPNGKITVTKKNKTVITYGLYGRLESIADKNGNAITFDFTGKQLNKITDGSGRITSFTYVGDKISTIVDPLGRKFSYTYAGDYLTGYTDPEGNTYGYSYNGGVLTGKTSPNNGTSTFNYVTTAEGKKLYSKYIDAEGFNQSFDYHFDRGYTVVKNREGQTLTYYYDGDKRTVRTTNEDGTNLYTEYDLKGNVLAEVNEKGHRTSFEYDANQNLAKVTNVIGSSVSMSYDSNNNITEIVDGEGNRTSFAYDVKGNLVRKSFANGAFEEYAYNSNGSLRTSKDALGNITNYVYDANGYLNKVTYPDGSFITILSDVIGQVKSITDETGAVTRLGYNNNGDVTSITDSLGFTTEYKFNQSGKIQGVVDALRNSVNFEYDVRKNLSKQTDALGNVQSFTYTPEEELAGVTMPDGSTYSYSYDARGRMTNSVQNELNASTNYEYDLLGNIVRKTDALGNVYNYVYDAMSRLIQVTDPEGGVTRFSYDRNNNVVSKTDANNNTSTFAYDSLNRLVRSTDAVGNVSTFKYDYAGNLTERVDAEGNRTTYVYDSRNRLTSVTDANGATSRFEYDAASRLTKETNALGNSTSYQYNSLGKVTRVIDSFNGTKAFTYDGNGNLLTATNENGSVVSYVYDALNRVVTSIDPDGNATNFQYNYQGKVTKVTDALNNVKTFQYDVLGRLVVSTDEVGATKSYTYDKNGNLVSYSDALGKVTSFNYDKLGRVLSKVNPMGETESYSYDALGNILETTDAKGYKFSYEYDSLNRLVKEINQAGVSQTFSYNKLGQVTYKQDFNGNTFTYQYDNVGRLLKELMPDGSAKEFTYDNAGNIVKAQDINSNLEYGYDALNRLVNVKDNNLLEEISYSYDAAGNRTNINWLNSTRDIKYTYGNRNEILSVTDDERKTTSFEYDVLGREIVRNLPNYTKMFKEYDAAGRLTSIKNTDRRNNVLGAEAYFYNIAGQRISDVDERGQVRTYNFDDAGRLIEAKYPLPSKKMSEDFTERVSQGLYPNYIGSTPIEVEGLGVIDSTTDIKSLLKNRLDVNELKAVITGDRSNWVTDHNNSGLEFSSNLNLPSDQLINMMSAFENIQKTGHYLDSNQSMWTEKFSYDKNSNLINKANGWGSIDYSYNSTNSMLTAGNRSFNYDNNGNLLTESLNGVDTTYKYNVNNRVIDVFTKAGKFNGNEADPYNRGVEYGYDVFGRRNSRIEYNGEITKEYLVESNEQTLYDGFGINPLADFVDNSLIYGDSSYYAGMKPQMEYVRANGSVISTGAFTTTSSRPRVNNREYIHQNILGSTMMVTGRTGSVTGRYNYDAFGNTYDGNFVGNVNKLGYNGKEFDPVSGIYNYGFRDYSARLARFTTIDPIRDGSNWYAYVGNDPINFIDPLGLCKESDENKSWFEQTVEFISNKIRGSEKLKEATQNGTHEDIFYLLGFVRDEDGVYHARQDAEQQKGGYNDFYDLVFSYATSMDKEKFDFTLDGQDYIFWAWKGDYLNLGAGAELGIYREPSSEDSNIERLFTRVFNSKSVEHWIADPSLALPMELLLTDKKGNIIANYKPQEDQWWITAFNPEHLNMSADDLTASFKVIFTGREDMYEAFASKWEGADGWIFPGDLTATFTF